MSGPWSLAKSERDSWGLDPSLWREPMMGRAVGSGGWFLGEERWRNGLIKKHREMQNKMM